MAAFEEYYDRHRRCGCHIDECAHMERAGARVFDGRISRLMAYRDSLVVRAYYDAVERGDVAGGGRGERAGGRA